MYGSVRVSPEECSVGSGIHKTSSSTRPTGCLPLSPAVPFRSSRSPSRTDSVHAATPPRYGLVGDQTGSRSAERVEDGWAAWRVEWTCTLRVVVGVLCNADSCIGAHPCTVGITESHWFCMMFGQHLSCRVLSC